MLLIFIILLAIVAAFFNALAAVIQRYATGRPESYELFRRNFIKSLSKNRKWIVGFGLEAIAFFLPGCSA